MVTRVSVPEEYKGQEGVTRQVALRMDEFIERRYGRLLHEAPRSGLIEDIGVLSDENGEVGFGCRHA